MTNKTIGIVFAMDVEFKKLIPLVSNLQEEIILNKTFYTGTYNNNKLVFAKAGIGKVNAGVLCALMIEHFNIDLVFNSGIGGGVSNTLKTLDTVIATEVMYSDVDMSGDTAGFKYGQLQGYPESFKVNNDLISKIQTLGIDTYYGPIMSGDQFVTDSLFVDNVKRKLNRDDILVCDMESGGISQVCFDNKKDLIVIRTVSDVVGNNNIIDYYDFFEKSANKSIEILTTIINNI